MSKIQNTRDTLQLERISIGMYITLNFTWLMFLISIWNLLPPIYLGAGILAFTFGILTLFGVKRNQLGTVAKAILERTMNMIQTARTIGGDDPWGILAKMEMGVAFMLDNWNDMFTFIKETDVPKPEPDTSKPEPEKEKEVPPESPTG